MGCAPSAPTAPAAPEPPGAAAPVPPLKRVGSGSAASDGNEDGAPPPLASSSASSRRDRSRHGKDRKGRGKRGAAKSAAGEAESEEDAPGDRLPDAAAAPSAPSAPASISASAVMRTKSGSGAAAAASAAAASAAASTSAARAAPRAAGSAARKRRPELEASLRQLSDMSSTYKFTAVKDNFRDLDEVTDGLRAAGLESSNLIVAIDFTKSNTWMGRETFGGNSLHATNLGFDNPYMLAIRTLGTTLATFDDDSLIPVFGFGDSTTTDRSVFPFFPDRAARGFEEVLERYRELVPRVVMSGPTNFAPAIEASIQIVERSRSYHILVIIADGQVTNRAYTEAAIVRASAYPLSIVLVGVGDGPWDMMEEFDDSLPQRKFDNFQFVNATEVQQKFPDMPDVAFALACLMEIPDQYHAIRSLGLL